jgi:anthranilate synthase component 2
VIIDNFDSFTYNLFHYFQPLVEQVEVIRYDHIIFHDLAKFDGIVLSPGPGLPSDYPLLKKITQEYGKIKPLLGVCLGHQAIADVFGARLINLPEVWHGVARETCVTLPGGIYEGIPEKFLSGRYHSWAVSSDNFPAELIVTSLDNNGTITSLQHKEFPITGIQFHPESVLSPEGKRILQNWVRLNF